MVLTGDRASCRLLVQPSYMLAIVMCTLLMTSVLYIGIQIFFMISCIAGDQHQK